MIGVKGVVLMFGFTVFPTQEPGILCGKEHLATKPMEMNENVNAWNYTSLAHVQTIKVLLIRASFIYVMACGFVQ